MSPDYLVLQDHRGRQESLQLCMGREVAATAWRTSSVTCKVLGLEAYRVPLVLKAHRVHRVHQVAATPAQ